MSKYAQLDDNTVFETIDPPKLTVAMTGVPLNHLILVKEKRKGRVSVDGRK